MPMNTAAELGTILPVESALSGRTTWTRAESTPSISLSVAESSWLSA
jgi:hypothetical protein